MKKTLFITALFAIATIVIGLVIWSDKKATEVTKDNTNIDTEVIAELPSIPEGFKEIVLDSGLRFGIPNGWEDSTLKLKVKRGGLSGYETSDYVEKIVVEREGEGEDDDSIVESGFSLWVEFSGNKIDSDYKAFFIDTYESRCKDDIKDKCSRNTELKGWIIDKINYNRSKQFIQYIYISEKVIEDKTVSFTLHPPQNANQDETEKLFTQILETVAVVQPK